MSARHEITIVGVGNAGLWTAIALAGWIRQAPGDAWRVLLIDHDIADERDVLKGLPPDLADGTRTKPDAVQAFLARMFGEDVGRAFIPIPVMAQSVPGLLRGPTRSTFVCTDSFGSAAFCSSAAALGGGWHARVATGVGADVPIWRVSVFPPGTGSLASGYDEAAWGGAGAVQSCVTGEEINPLDGAEFPPGVVVGALAVAAWAQREHDPDPYDLELSGSTPERVARSDQASGTPVPETVPVHACGTLGEIGAWSADRFGADPADIGLRFEVPVVLRGCGCGGWVGFERWPRGRCERCGQKSALVRTLERVPGAPDREFASMSLAALAAPVGVAFEARAGDGARVFQLPVGVTDLFGPLGAAARSLPEALCTT